MKKGYVILIALVIAIGLTFIIMALGLLIAYIRRRRKGTFLQILEFLKWAWRRLSPGELLEEMKNILEAIPEKV